MYFHNLEQISLYFSYKPQATTTRGFPVLHVVSVVGLKKKSVSNLSVIASVRSEKAVIFTSKSLALKQQQQQTGVFINLAKNMSRFQSTSFLSNGSF